MSRHHGALRAEERKLWPDEAEFVVLWLEVGYSLERVATVMDMTLSHARHFLPGQPSNPAARKRLEQRSAFARPGVSA
jgi:hypothetical protein